MTLYYYIVPQDKAAALINDTGIEYPEAVPLGDNEKVIITSAVQFDGYEAMTNEQVKELKQQYNGDT
jgi:hypothetical protein|tara:strand:- start:142 stop:342 length:201 start_codon:yes stop_codon:yes gene_type:complete